MKTRKVFFDTETTGLSAEKGDRVIQIGLVEMVDGKISQQKEYYLNPEGRKSSRGSFEVHGIHDRFLLDKPTFREVADEFLAFIQGAELFAHNARFDINMINNELSLIGKSERIDQICKITDTIDLVKQNLPVTRYSLDTVMKYLKIDYEHQRETHSALEDSIILAKVYLAMFKTETNLFTDITAGADLEHEKELHLNHESSKKIKVKLSTVSAEEESLHQQFFELAHQKTIR